MEFGAYGCECEATNFDDQRYAGLPTWLTLFRRNLNGIVLTVRLTDPASKFYQFKCSLFHEMIMVRDRASQMAVSSGITGCRY
jgi:hypothetical protein